MEGVRDNLGEKAGYPVLFTLMNFVCRTLWGVCFLLKQLHGEVAHLSQIFELSPQ